MTILSPSLAMDRLKRAINIVKKNEAKISPQIWLGSKKKYTVTCKNGHTWATTIYSILRKTWCQQCWRKYDAGKHLLLDGLKEAQEIARARGGISTELTYKNSVTPLSWKCIVGHEWNAALSDVKKGSWCPECSWKTRERICRVIFQEMFGVPFQHTRSLLWLKSPKGGNWELDGFNDQLKLAFEYHGEYHYKYSSFFHKKISLEQRQEVDKIKAELCHKNGILLIEVPYFIDFNDLPSFILDKIKYSPYLISCVKKTKDFDFNLAHCEINSKLNELKEKATKKGGNCLSDIWLGYDHKYKMICEFGHTWTSIANNILKNDTWCPKCKSKRISSSHIDKDGLSKIKNHCIARVGECISDIYLGVDFKHKFKCKNNHFWEACPADIYRGTWCNKCRLSENKINQLNDLKLIALNMGMEVLSDIYISSYTNLKIKCQNSHIFEIRPNNFKNNISKQKKICKYCNKEDYDERKSIICNNAEISYECFVDKSILPITNSCNG